MQNLWLADIDCACKLHAHYLIMRTRSLWRGPRPMTARETAQGPNVSVTATPGYVRISSPRFGDLRGSCAARIDRAISIALDDLRENNVAARTLGTWMMSEKAGVKENVDFESDSMQLKNRIEGLLDSSVFRQILVELRRGGNSNQPPQSARSITPVTAGANTLGGGLALDFVHLIDWMRQNSLISETESDHTIQADSVKHSELSSTAPRSAFIDSFCILDAVRQVFTHFCLYGYFT